MKKNNKGESVLMFLFSVTTIFILFITSANFQLKKHRQLKERIDLYLCTKKITNYTKDYVHRIIWGNRLLSFNEILPSSLVFPYSLIANVTKKTIMAKQELIHVSFLNQIRTIKSCSIQNKLEYATNLPFGLSIPLIRNEDMSVKLRSNKWSFHLRSKNIVIQGRYYLKSNTSTYQKLSLKQLSSQIKDSQQLVQYF